MRLTAAESYMERQHEDMAAALLLHKELSGLVRVQRELIERQVLVLSTYCEKLDEPKAARSASRLSARFGRKESAGRTTG
jgi:hypothetical protein